MIAEQLRFHNMPPKYSKQPTDPEREQTLAWIRSRLLETQGPNVTTDRRLLLPEFGNYIDHDALFTSSASPVSPAAPRVWRIRPEIYESLLSNISAGVEGLSQPFPMRSSGIRDFAALYFVDEPATDLLLSNAALLVANQAKNKEYRHIYEALQPDREPDEKRMVDAIRQEFRLALHREPSAEEIARFVKLWQNNVATSGHPIGSQATLQAVLMQAEALFRLELGKGDFNNTGVRRLSQKEIALAVSYALRDWIDDKILAAAHRGKLATRHQVAAHVERLLDDPIGDNPRLLQFFREYFGYPNAVNVFKDAPERGVHDARILVSDLEYLIIHILEVDRDVLRHLLTTDKTFVNWHVAKKDGAKMPAKAEIGFEAVYGLPVDWKWTDEQPITLPERERAGILTHPAWLVAWSGNFDNDPVRRGKWIRMNLLGGSVPDVPIGVDARIPEDEHRTLRERLKPKTSKPECWRCHRKMDPLGLPFEQYTHYGHFRNYELDKPVVTTGIIDRTGDPRLDGTQVNGPLALVAKLADSERVEQVFVRHAFRFFLGRNETLGDAKTLQDAWKRYHKTGGSFKALVASLLTSDSFLYRTP